MVTSSLFLDCCYQTTATLSNDPHSYRIHRLLNVTVELIIKIACVVPLFKADVKSIGLFLFYPPFLKYFRKGRQKRNRIMFRSAFDAHAEPLFKELKILKLSDTYRSQTGKLMFSIWRGLLHAFNEMFLLTNQICHYNNRF